MKINSIHWVMKNFKPITIQLPIHLQISQEKDMKMNIKKLLIITVFIVGLAPKNTLSGSGYCMPCSRNQYEAEEEDADLRSVSTEPIERAEQEEQQEAEQLIEFLEQQHPTMQYESSAAHE